jgi:hypothetical protein
VKLRGQAAIDYAARAGLALEGPAGVLELMDAEKLMGRDPELVMVDTLPDEEEAPPVPLDSPLARMLGVKVSWSN